MVTLEEKLVPKEMNGWWKEEKRRDRGEEGSSSIIIALIQFSSIAHYFPRCRHICMSVNVANVDESECDRCDGRSFHTDHMKWRECGRELGRRHYL